jgi:hypothetical protein
MTLGILTTTGVEAGFQTRAVSIAVCFLRPNSSMCFRRQL